MKGTIKVLLAGFGFIESESLEENIFFHANNLEGVAFDDLEVGNELEFEMGEGKNGKQQAINVTLV
jgi:CspA family cold shock protein